MTWTALVNWQPTTLVLLLAVGGLLIAVWRTTPKSGSIEIVAQRRVRLGRSVLIAIVICAALVLLQPQVMRTPAALVLISQSDLSTLSHSGKAALTRLGRVQFAVVDGVLDTVRWTSCGQQKIVKQSQLHGTLPERLAQVISGARFGHCGAWFDDQYVYVIQSPALSRSLGVAPGWDPIKVATQMHKDKAAAQPSGDDIPFYVLTAWQPQSAVYLPREGWAAANSSASAATVVEAFLNGVSVPQGASTVAVDVRTKGGTQPRLNEVPVQRVGDHSAIVGPIPIRLSDTEAESAGVYRISLDISGDVLPRSVSTQLPLVVDPPKLGLIDARGNLNDVMRDWRDWGSVTANRVGLLTDLLSPAVTPVGTCGPPTGKVRDIFRFPYTEISTSRDLNVDGIELVGQAEASLDANLRLAVANGLHLVLIQPPPAAQCEGGALTRQHPTLGWPQFRSPRILFLPDLSRVSFLSFAAGMPDETSIALQYKLIEFTLKNLGGSAAIGVPLEPLKPLAGASYFEPYPASGCTRRGTSVRLPRYVVGMGDQIATIGDILPILGRDACLPAQGIRDLQLDPELIGGADFASRALNFDLGPSSAGLRLKWAGSGTNILVDTAVGPADSLVGTTVIEFVNDIPAFANLPASLQLSAIAADGTTKSVPLAAGTPAGESAYSEALQPWIQRGAHVVLVAIGFPGEVVAGAKSVEGAQGDGRLPSKYCEVTANVTCLRIALGTADSVLKQTIDRIGGEIRDNLGVQLSVASTAARDLRYSTDGGPTPFDAVTPYASCVDTDQVLARVRAGTKEGIASIRRDIGFGSITVLGVDPYAPLNWIKDATDAGLCLLPQPYKAVRAPLGAVGLGAQHVRDLMFDRLPPWGGLASLGPFAATATNDSTGLVIRLPTPQTGAGEDAVLVSGDQIISQARLADEPPSNLTTVELTLPPRLPANVNLRLPGGRTLPFEWTATPSDSFSDTIWWNDFAKATGGDSVGDAAVLRGRYRVSLADAGGAMCIFLVALYFSPLCQPWPWLEAYRRRRWPARRADGMAAAAVALDAVIQEAGHSLGQPIGRKLAGERIGVARFSAGDSLSAALAGDLASFTPWGRRSRLPIAAPRVRNVRRLEATSVSLQWDLGPLRDIHGKNDVRTSLDEEYALASLAIAKIATIGGIPLAIRDWRGDEADELQIEGDVEIAQVLAALEKALLLPAAGGREPTWATSDRLAVLISPLGSESWETCQSWIQSLLGEQIRVLCVHATGLPSDFGAGPYRLRNGLAWVDRAEYLGWNAAAVLKEHKAAMSRRIRELGASYLVAPSLSGEFTAEFVLEVSRWLSGAGASRGV